MSIIAVEQDSKILVTGATGHVGGHVVSQLLSTGADVRALTRDPDSAGLPESAQVVRGDLSEPETLDAPLEGVEAVFLMWPFLTAEAAPAVLDAVKRHARCIVYLSAMGVGDDLEEQTDPILQFHADIEHLIEQSGLEWTLVRSGGMATNTLWWAPQIRADDVLRWFYGDASRSLIHEADVAAVAVRALIEDDHVGETYSVTGPEVLTQVEQVRAIGEVIGRPVRFEEISPETARKEMLAGMPDAVVDGILGAHATFAEEPETVTSTVEEVTGAPARTFREWAIDHAADFRAKIGFLGAGQMGRTLARLLTDAGHRVQLANSRGPASLASVVAELGSKASAGTPQEMVRFADVVVLATRWEQTPMAVEGIGPWDGKIVIDTTNNRTGSASEDVVDLGGRTSSEVIADLLPGARIVKAFNHARIPALAESLGPSPSERKALFVAGDDLEAKRRVMRLIRNVGGEPIDTGSLREGGRLQGTGGPLHGRLSTPTEARRLLAEVSGQNQTK